MRWIGVSRYSNAMGIGPIAIAYTIAQHYSTSYGSTKTDTTPKSGFESGDAI